LEITKGKLLYEGKYKKLYSTGSDDFLILHFKDNAYLARNEKTTIKNKGTNNCKISALLFKYFESHHIPTHFVELFKSNEVVIKRCDIFDFFVKVWNISAGSFSSRYKIKKGEALNMPIIEYYLKREELNYPMISADYIIAMGIAQEEELRTINQLSKKGNAVIKSFFARRSLELCEINFEFGKHKNKIMLTDEISPDTFYFIDSSSKEKMDNRELIAKSQNRPEAYLTLTNRICAK